MRYTAKYILAAAVLLGSCTVQEGPLTPQAPVEGTVGVTMPAEVKAPTEDNTAVRIIMQAWTPGENGASGELAFEYVWNNKKVSEGLTGEPVRMIPGTYDILFWADRDADGIGNIYNAEYLNKVKWWGWMLRRVETMSAGMTGMHSAGCSRERSSRQEQVLTSGLKGRWRG